MTEYCSVQVTETWEPDIDPNIVVEYVFDGGNSDIHNQSVKSRTRDHLSSLSSLPQRLQVTQLGHDEADDGSNCQITLQCKALYAFSIAGVSVASEARMVEVYNAKDGSYLQTVRGVKDKEDSEADNSRVHFLCQCHLDRSLGGVTVKFLSLGQRKSFEIAHISVVLETSSTASGGPGAQSQQTIDMDRLRQDVDDMGDAVSDRAKAFLTTLENFQKNKHGAVGDLRHLLLDAPEGVGPSMAGITTLLSMFASSTAKGANAPPTGHAPSAMPAEGSVMNNMLSQMMSSLAVGAEGQGEGCTGVGAGGDKDDMYQFLQVVCGQVSKQRTEEEAQPGADPNEHQAAGKGSGDMVESSAEMESRVTAQVEAAMESRLTAVEEHIRQQVDQRIDDLETRMTGKLDAIFALLQSQKQS